MKTTSLQPENRPAGRRKRIAHIFVASMLAAAFSPSCRAQAAIEAAPLQKPPVAPAVTVPDVAAPLHAPPAHAGAIQASITGGAALPGSFSAISRVAAENNILHVTVGHQLFIDTKSRLRRVYVADPSVLNSVTLTPNQIVVTAMGPGISSLTLLDEIGRAQSYMISSDLDIDGLRAAMQEALSADHIRVEGSGGRVVLSGVVSSQAAADSAVKLAGMYAKDVVNALTIAPGHPKQVKLQVRILEVDRTKAEQYGINLFNPGGNTSWFAATTTNQYPSTATVSQGGTGGSLFQVATSNPLNLFLYSLKANVGATIQDLQNKQVLQILAEPTITTISGQKADFLSGGEFPFPIVQPGGNGGAPVVTIQFRDFGVKLEFTPIVNDDGTIRLQVAPEVSALDYANAVSVSGFTVPAISTRKASTQVELRSNQSFAISGLLDQRTSDLLAKNPGIASIPILGTLFKSKNVNHSATELVVIVTPSVVDPLTETDQPVQPDMPIPTLDRPAFDNSLGATHNPRPAAPSLDPNRPPYGDAVPAPLPPDPNSPDNRIVGDAEPKQSAPAQQQGTTAPVVQPQSPAPQPAVPARPAQSQTAPVAAPPVNPPAAPAAEREQKPVSPAPGVASGTSTGVSRTTVVEIMALSHVSDADAALSALRRHGYNPVVNHGTQDSLLHLDLGPFPSRTQAEAVRQQLLHDGYDATLK